MSDKFDLVDHMLEQQRRTYSARHRNGDVLIGCVESMANFDTKWVHAAIWTFNIVMGTLLALDRYGVLDRFLQ